MATQYKWTVNQMFCYPEAEGYQDVVFSAVWVCLGIDTINNIEYSSTSYATTPVKLDSGSPYIPYQDLTQDEVLNWIWTSGVDKDATEAEVDAKIQALVNPTVISPPLPWNPQLNAVL
jgi:hypothetical protein